MPGPDDTLHFLQRHAKKKGYAWPEDLDQVALSALRIEAELLHHAERGLGALMKLYLRPADTAVDSIRWSVQQTSAHERPEDAEQRNGVWLSDQKK